MLATCLVASIIFSSLQLSGAKVDLRFFREKVPSGNRLIRSKAVVVPSGLLVREANIKSGLVLILGECAPTILSELAGRRSP